MMQMPLTDPHEIPEDETATQPQDAIDPRTDSLELSIDALEVGKAERNRMKEAMAIFRGVAMPPAPERKVNFIRDFGPEVFGLLISALGSIVISALRVGTVLFVSEMNLATLYSKVGTHYTWLTDLLGAAPVLMFLAGTLGFEGYLFARGYRAGKQSGQTKISSSGVVIAFLVTISAGLLSSLTLGDSSQAWVQNATGLVQAFVVVSTGIGAPILAYFGAENIGVVVNSYLQEKKVAAMEHADAQGLYMQKFLKYYQRNALRLFGVDRSPVREEAPKAAPVVEQEEEEGVGVTAEVKQWLIDANVTPWEIGVKKGQKFSPAVIAQALALSDSGPVRTALVRLRKTWPKSP